jgi:hypothetical protein
MKLNRLVDFQGKQMHASDIARSIRPDIRKVWKGKKPWDFTKSCWIPKVDKDEWSFFGRGKMMKMERKF